MKLNIFSFVMVIFKNFKNVVFKTGAIISFWAARDGQYTGDRTVFVIDRTVVSYLWEKHKRQVKNYVDISDSDFWSTELVFA